MKETERNFWLDIRLFVTFLATVFTGLLLWLIAKGFNASAIASGSAKVVGVLFIIGTVSGLLMLPFIAILNTPDHLTTVAAHEGQMIIAALLKFIMGVACAGIGLALYPILKKYNEGLAIGAAGFRVIEGMVDIVGALGYVALLALSQEFVKAGAPASSYFQTADVLINAGAFAR